MLALLITALQSPAPAAAPASLPAAVPALAARAAPAPDRRALLIGVGRYSGRSGGDPQALEGPPRDVAEMRRLLVDRFDFPPANVLTLLDEEATHAAVVRAFAQHLIAPALPDSEVLFYFSGHGSRAQDLAPDDSPELGGADSTIVCWDSARGMENQQPDLTDDELHSLLAVLAQRTQRIVVLTDCCHSGGLTRGAARRRALEPGIAPRPEHLESFWPIGVPFLEDDRQGRRGAIPWVHVAACEFDESAHERAFELDGGGSEVRGVFTWHLVRALESAQPGATWGQIAARVSAQAAAEDREDAQHAHGVGLLQRRVFSGDFAPPPPGFAAELREDGQTLLVRGGSLHLVQPSTRFRIVEGETLLGEAVISRHGLGLTHCVAQWAKPELRVRGPRAVRALPIGGVAPREPIALLAPPGAEMDALLAPAIEAGLVRRALHRQDAELLLEAPTPAAPCSVLDAEHGLLLARLDPRGPTAKQALQEFLRRELRWRATMELQQRDESGALRAAWHEPTAAELHDAQRRADRHFEPIELRADAGGNVSAALDGEESALGMLEISLPSGPDVQGVYVTVLCVSEDRSIAPIFPRSGDRENALESGETMRLPVEVFLPEEWAPGRPLRDRYLIIATRDFSDFTPLAQEGTLGATLRSSSPRPADLIGALTGTRPTSDAAAQARWSLAFADLALTRD